MKKPFISIVVPVFGAGFDANLFYSEFYEALSSWACFEIIFVNDNYEDENWESIKYQEGLVENVISTCNGSNKGQHYSTHVGLKLVNGDYIVVADCDGQDNPFEIKKMYDVLVAGSYKVVFGRRAKRQDPIGSIFFAKFFYFFLNRLTAINFDNKTTSFSVSTRKLVDELLVAESNLIIYGISIRKITSLIGYCDVDHRKRNLGGSSYSFFSRFILAIRILKYSFNKKNEKKVKRLD